MSITPKRWIWLIIIAAPVNAQTGNWTQQHLVTNPGPRGTPRLAYDSKHSQVVLFGGGPGTWIWDGSNWTQLNPTQSPPLRSNSQIAYDSAHGQVVMFGGQGQAPTYPRFNDTWLWDGSNWTESPQIGPSERTDGAMAYDAQHGQVVLFGGQAGNGASFNDTWLWDGSRWSLAHPQTSPPMRHGHAMDYDSTRGQVVLFGGNNSNSNFADTWTWDGTNWTELKPQTSPPARSYHQMVYDSAHDQMVLFGGGTSDDYTANIGLFSDTWLWDGVNWTQAIPATSPSARNRFGMAFDAGHAQAVLFGGRHPDSTVLDETWTWAVPAVTPPPGPTISSVVSASGFGGFSNVAPGSWIEIYGSNLAPDTRQWATSDFSGSDAPTSLDGVEVLIGGQNAFVDYISSGQINAQLPSTISTGAALPLSVMNGTTSSSSVNITVHALQPGLLAPASLQIGGKQYVVAVLPDGAYVLPSGAISGVASRPAQPGDVITLYGVGFGAVTPAIPAGQIAGEQNQLEQPLAISFAKTPAQITYDGLAPGFVGLYQFDVVVPQVPDNLLTPLTFTLGGQAGTQTLYIAVEQGSS
ncbi:MAG TPA: kelch repeat-containing protein [Bryobacteraceae bacterium]|nr:kelch repeat-containing protein [Bryobacteraceae bacterium]